MLKRQTTEYWRLRRNAGQQVALYTVVFLLAIAGAIALLPAGWHDDGVGVWDELTAEHYAVMINAVEEAYLNGVVYKYNRRVNGQVKVGDVLVARPISEHTVRSLIPASLGWSQTSSPWTGSRSANRTTAFGMKLP